MVVTLCSALISSVLRRVPCIQKKLTLKTDKSVCFWLVKSDETSETIWHISMRWGLWKSRTGRGMYFAYFPGGSHPCKYITWFLPSKNAKRILCPVYRKDAVRTDATWFSLQVFALQTG